MPGQAADLGHHLHQRLHILQDRALQLRGAGCVGRGRGAPPSDARQAGTGTTAGKALHHGAAGRQPRQGHPLRAHSGPRVRERQWSEVWRWRGGGGAPRKGQPRGAVSVPSGGWCSPHPGPRPPVRLRPPRHHELGPRLPLGPWQGPGWSASQLCPTTPLQSEGTAGASGRPPAGQTHR